MRSLERVFNFAQDTANIGVPLTSKKETIEERIELEDLKKMFVEDEVTNNCVNIWTQLIFSSEHRLTNKSLDLFLDAVGDIGNPTTWSEMEFSIFQNAIVYGSSWIELIYGRTNGKIVDLVSVNPEKMDYAKDGQGRIAVDKYSRPLGYIHKIPYGFTAPRTIPLPEGVATQANELFIPPEKIAHIKFPINVGDGLRPYGLIEPGYKSLKRRKELEECYATALEKSLPVRVGRYGDQMNRPTPQKLKDLLSIVTNLRGKTDAVALPYHSTIEMLESKGIQNMLEPLKYYLSLGIAPFGIPISLAVGIGSEVNRSTLNVLRDIYSKRVKVVIQQISTQIERQIFRPVAESNGIKEYPRYEWDDIVLRTEDIDNTDRVEKPVPEELSPKNKDGKKKNKFVF